jgi:hypothetical protein
MNHAANLSSSLFTRKLRHNKSELEEIRERMLPMTVLADETFGINELGESNIASFYEAVNETILHEEVGMQLSLQLEDPSALLAHYRKMIRRYEQGYERMAAFALKWHSLMEDVEADPSIKKMFNDMQIIRKLSRDPVL